MAGDARDQRAGAVTGRSPRRRSKPIEPAEPAELAEPADAEAAATGHMNGGPNRPGPAQLMLDIEFVRSLIAAVDDSGIDTLEINRAGTRIRISKTAPPPRGPAVSARAAGPVAAQAAGVAAEPAPVEAVEAPAAPAINLVEVKSPMVGTFYRAPAPEAPSYVEVGSLVSKGQTLCILEAMKLMNEMESEVDGIVRQILAENADPVQYGQVLFRIEPSGS